MSDGPAQRPDKGGAERQCPVRLDDELYTLNQRLGETEFPKPAKAHLDDWAAPVERAVASQRFLSKVL